MIMRPEVNLSNLLIAMAGLASGTSELIWDMRRTVHFVKPEFMLEDFDKTVSIRPARAARMRPHKPARYPSRNPKGLGIRLVHVQLESVQPYVRKKVQLVRVSVHTPQMLCRAGLNPLEHLARCIWLAVGARLGCTFAFLLGLVFPSTCGATSGKEG
jgi:hypothetical protein